MIYLPLGTRVIGNWGAMSPPDFGEIIGIASDATGHLIKWDNEEREPGHYRVIFKPSANGSPIGVWVDPDCPKAPVILEYNDEMVSVYFNEFGSMFTLEPTTYRDEVIAYCCPRGQFTSAPNQCWVLREFFQLFAKRGIVSAVMNGPNMVVEECDESDVGEAVLCDIRHPKFNDGGYSPFGDFSRNRLGQQCQYGSRYITGRIEGYSNLGEGLRFKNVDSGNYHDIRIHRDDMDEFERRYRAHQDMKSPLTLN